MTRLLPVMVMAAVALAAGPRSTWATATRARRRVRAFRAPAAPGSHWPGSSRAPGSWVSPRRPDARPGPAARSVDLDHAVVLETVARSLRSGSSFTGALGEAVAELSGNQAADDLDRALSAVRAGAPVVEALERWAGPDAGRGRARVLAGTSLVLGAELGGMPARSLDAAAAGLRDRAALALEVRALSSQARASAAVMVLGPPVFLVLASGADHRLLHVLLGTPLGLGCVAAGVVLDASGAWWMAWLVRRVS